MLELEEWEYSCSSPSIDLLRLEMPAFHTPKNEQTLPVQKTPLLANTVLASMPQTPSVPLPLDRTGIDKSLGMGLQSYLYSLTLTWETNLETKSPPKLMSVA